MQRKSLKNSDCPVGRALDVVGDWWSLLILRDAFSGKRRFGEFQESLDIAKNILSARLRKLVERGILETVPAADGSAFHEYALTQEGRGLFIVIAALRQWGASTLFNPGESPPTIVDRRTHSPIPPLELRSKDGRLLRPEDVEILSSPMTRSIPRRARTGSGKKKAVG